MKKILITDAVHPILIEGLRQRNYEVDYQPEISYLATKEIIQNYTALIVNSKIKCDEKLFGETPKVRWIARLGSGLEVIDKDFCTKNNIHFFNSPEGNRQAVAEHTLGLLLDLLNNISKANSEVKQKNWFREVNRGEELSGKTVGIIGFGNTGLAFSNLLKGFDCEVLAYDKYRKNYGNDFVKESSLQTIFELTDVVSIHLPLTEETTFFCNNNFFNQFKKSIYFINTSRGKIVLQKDLIDFVEQKKIRGVGLDVLENEKLFSYCEEENTLFEKLISFDNVVITPHVAGWTFQSFYKIATTILENVDRLND